VHGKPAGPSLEQFLAAAKKDPRNKGASDDDLREPLAEELRRRQVMAVYDPFKDPAPAKGGIADPFAQGYQAPTIGGEFKKGIASGIDNLQASLYGLAGLAGDFTGVEPVKKMGARRLRSATTPRPRRTRPRWAVSRTWGA
jgi:hypothetical protein